LERKKQEQQRQRRERDSIANLDLDSLLEDSTESRPAATASRTNEPATVIASTIMQRRCFRPPNGQHVVLTLRIKLARNGRVMGQSQPLGLFPSTQRERQIYHFALRALQDCQPFQLPVEHYDDWKVVDVIFDSNSSALR
jgi:hypothetical protein